MRLFFTLSLLLGTMVFMPFYGSSTIGLHTLSFSVFAQPACPPTDPACIPTCVGGGIGCPPPPPTCSAYTTCSGYYTPYNTCYGGNSTQVCTQRNTNCSTNSWTNSRTVNNCGGPHVCSGGRCIPWCNTGNAYGACDHIGVNTTCFRNNAYESCTYTRYSGGGACIQIACPNRACTLNSCTNPTWGCVTGRCVPYWTVSGNITDVDNGGNPGIPVHVAGFTLSGGPYLFGYGDKIRTGNYTVSETIPVDYIPIGPTTRGIRVGPNAGNINFQVAKIFTISGKVYDAYNNNKGVPGVRVSVGGFATTTDGAGNYTIGYGAKLRKGTHTVTVTIPVGYTNVTATSQNVVVGPNKVGINFGITKLFQITGTVFVDPNVNGIQDPGEPNYPTKPVFTASRGTVTTNAGGTYTITNLITGNVTISYWSLPPSYYITSPFNGPPPSFVVHIGFGCNTNGAPGAQCLGTPTLIDGGDIAKLNYGIINDIPWVQSVCGDIRSDNGFANQVPLGFSAFITNASCTTPGIVFTGNVNADFGSGTASSTNQIVGGTQYPETFNPAAIGRTSISYTSLYAKAISAGLTMVNLQTGNNVTSGTNIMPPPCSNLTNCTLPANLPHGIYYANGSVTLNAYTFPTPLPNQNYVFLINGDLTITGNIIIPPGDSVIFAVSGNIIIPASVGSNYASNAPNLEGIYSTEKSFIAYSTNICPDLRLNIQGEIIVNAAHTGGSLVNSRNLCQFNALYPALQIIQRPDFLLHLPDFTRILETTSQEVAP
ncbi:MAG TPA: hypothetical protein VNW29_05345 [Candidatus Sulfotelmatobacter sp.]|nr:hypothetical protein [Candidatus Sulfotelmatobacter sp.]